MIEARDTGSPAAGRDGAGQDFWPEDKPRRNLPNPKLLYGGAAAVVAVVVIAVVAVVVLGGGGGDGGKAAEKATPTAYTPDFSGDGFGKIAQRTADTRAITQGEAFSADGKTLKQGKYTLTLAASDLTSDCKSASWGSRLQADLARYGCSQVVRSAYVSPDKKYVGQFMVVNLASQEGSAQVLRDLDKATGAGWLTPLQPKGVPSFGPGFTAAYASVYGHYAVVTWVERAGGARPDSLNEMIDVSLVVENAGDFLYQRLDLAGSGAS
ncbi:hypothetical protein [Actinomadura opuntiae]|uniref:hypothetical protein n=1 Tax=Actinomadura sp. OS1-43 TaxID=604315 RepID=UPI00255ACF13|nr:hypothetical protein [Actinomadura sp. OS1-43]MDL4822093.1 hypothetical protein [Actinomadura sp. OS1-43]